MQKSITTVEKKADIPKCSIIWSHQKPLLINFVVEILDFFIICDSWSIGSNIVTEMARLSAGLSCSVIWYIDVRGMIKIIRFLYYTHEDPKRSFYFRVCMIVRFCFICGRRSVSRCKFEVIDSLNTPCLLNPFNFSLFQFSIGIKNNQGCQSETLLTVRQNKQSFFQMIWNFKNNCFYNWQF